MPWKENALMSLRLAFVHAALQEGANTTQLCQQFGVSRRVGNRWLARRQAEGPAGLAGPSRRPHTSPNQTPADAEQRLLAVRHAHPVWGVRKIRAWFGQRRAAQDWPSLSTITAILHCHEQIAPEELPKHRVVQRFEMSAPNHLWQDGRQGLLYPWRRGLLPSPDCARFRLLLAT